MFLAIAIIAGILLLQCFAQLFCLWRDGRKFSAPGTLINLPGRIVHFHQMGSGSPAVVFEAGIAASSLNWSVLQPQLARFTTTFSYDRAGLGWSTSTGRQCMVSRMADELHDWIAAVRVPRPYVLVGHSYAGYILRCYAQRFSGELSGVVLIDPLTPEEWINPGPEQRSGVRRAVWFARAGAVLSALGVLRFCLWLLDRGNKAVPRRVLGSFGASARETVERILGELSKLPPETVRLIRERWGHPKFFLVMARYIQSLPACAAEASRYEIPSHIPLTVISGAHQPEIRMAEHKALAARARRGRHIVAGKSAHWVHLDQPELIAQALRDMIAALNAEAAPASQ